MPNYVVQGGEVQCEPSPSHGGIAPFLSGSPKLAVAGHSIVVSGLEVGISFAATDTPCPFTFGPFPSPCTATLAAASGVSLRLSVDGLGVLLESAQGAATNANDPAATWSVLSPGQAILQET
jgi:hypothetical protein